MFFGSLSSLAAGTVFTVLLLWAALGDLRSRRIPNKVVVAIAVLGVAYSAFSGGIHGIGSSFGGIATGLVCWLPFYVLGWLGAGDVKMFAASGAWLGPMKALEGSLIAALIGALLAVLWMMRVRGFRNSLETLSMATSSPTVLASGAKQSEVERGTMPYGIAIAAGALWAAWLPVFLLR